MYVEVNGISLFYEKCGQGFPLILLHGNGEDHHIFDKLVEKLQKHFCVYALDSRNHGCSSKNHELSYDAMAEDVYGFICALELGKINFIGFSDGAIVALSLALKHEEMVESMALLGLNLKPSDFTEESYLFVKDSFEKTGDPLFKLMLEQPNIELEEIRKVSASVFLIAAENDIYRPEVFIEMLDAFPDVESLIMQGHDHGSYILNQDILYPDLLRFFSKSNA